jgi:predicted RNase H-like HicB family nuclease
MNERAVYEVEACREGRWWAISAPELPGVHSQARTLADVEPTVREAIALWLSATTGIEVAEGDFDVDVHVQLPAQTDRALAAWRKSAARAEKARVEAAERQVAAAEALVGRAGLTLKDAGQLLGGLSLQRIGQLVSGRSRTS